MTKTASSVDGKNWDDPVYKFSVEITTEEYSQLHNAKEFTANDDLKVGDTIEITLTEDELQELRQKDRVFYAQEPESEETAGRVNDSFADYLSRKGEFGILPELFSLKHAPDAYDYSSAPPEIDLEHPLPGEVTIVSG